VPFCFSLREHGECSGAVAMALSSDPSIHISLCTPHLSAHSLNSSLILTRYILLGLRMSAAPIFVIESTFHGERRMMQSQIPNQTTKLVVRLPSSLDRILRANLKPDEEVLIALKGTFGEALVCTDCRVLIIKTGYMTGHIFGSNIFQLPYAGITGAQVNAHFLTGYFELSAGGVQNAPMSYWQDVSNSFHHRRGTQAPQSPEKSPHCVSLRRSDFATFREASTFIIEKATQARSPAATAAHSPSDGIGLLEQLGKLRDSGVLTETEFQAKKAEILARV
jgi:hypothetical protein